LNKELDKTIMGMGGFFVLGIACLLAGDYEIGALLLGVVIFAGICL
jgi:hypothetical protein